MLLSYSKMHHPLVRAAIYLGSKWSKGIEKTLRALESGDLLWVGGTVPGLLSTFSASSDLRGPSTKVSSKKKVFSSSSWSSGQFDKKKRSLGLAHHYFFCPYFSIRYYPFFGTPHYGCTHPLPLYSVLFVILVLLHHSENFASACPAFQIILPSSTPVYLTVPA